LIVKGLCNTLKYHAHLCKSENSNSLLGQAVSEMKMTNDPNLIGWWARVDEIKKLFGLKYSNFSNIESIGIKIKTCVKSKFEDFWLRKIKSSKIDKDGRYHNKLEFYSSIKGSFKKEPYIDFVPNRSQRADLTRLRISASRLAIETGRYIRPPVPPERRFCLYCRPLGTSDNFCEGFIDNESHLLLQCETLTLKRNCFLAKFRSITPFFDTFTENQKLSSILCPRDICSAKTVNKYIQILFRFRSNIDQGEPAQYQNYEGGVIVNEFFHENDND
jgi:hypothetical protein